MQKVSVIVPCYNQAAYLEETLNSILKQSYNNWECIIVNDGSTDDTERICKNWSKKDHRFKYIFQENAGLASARNNGITNSCGEYILPLDSDDLIHEKYIEATSHILDENIDINIVYSNVQLFGSSDELWDKDNFNLNEFLFRNLIICTALYRKTDWERSGGYNQNMKKGFEDWDFWMSIIERGGKVYKIDKTLFFYRQRHDSMAKKITKEVADELKKQLAMNHLEFYAKHLGDPLSLSIKIREFERQIKLIENSLANRFGNFVLFPLKRIQQLLKRK